MKLTQILLGKYTFLLVLSILLIGLLSAQAQQCSAIGLMYWQNPELSPTQTVWFNSTNFTINNINYTNFTTYFTFVNITNISHANYTAINFTLDTSPLRNGTSRVFIQTEFGNISFNNTSYSYNITNQSVIENYNITIQAIWTNGTTQTSNIQKTLNFIGNTTNNITYLFNSTPNETVFINITPTQNNVTISINHTVHMSPATYVTTCPSSQTNNTLNQLKTFSYNCSVFQNINTTYSACRPYDYGVADSYQTQAYIFLMNYINENIASTSINNTCFQPFRALGERTGLKAIIRNGSYLYQYRTTPGSHYVTINGVQVIGDDPNGGLKVHRVRDNSTHICFDLIYCRKNCNGVNGTCVTKSSNNEYTANLGISRADYFGFNGFFFLLPDITFYNNAKDWPDGHFGWFFNDNITRIMIIPTITSNETIIFRYNSTFNITIAQANSTYPTTITVFEVTFNSTNNSINLRRLFSNASYSIESFAVNYSNYLSSMTEYAFIRTVGGNSHGLVLHKNYNQLIDGFYNVTTITNQTGWKRNFLFDENELVNYSFFINITTINATQKNLNTTNSLLNLYNISQNILNQYSTLLNIPFNVIFNSSTGITSSRSYFENMKLYEFINLTHLRSYDIKQRLDIPNTSINSSCAINTVNNITISAVNTFAKCYNRTIANRSSIFDFFFTDLNQLLTSNFSFYLFNKTDLSATQQITQFCRANMLYSNQLITPELAYYPSINFNFSIYVDPYNTNYETIIANNTAGFVYDKELNTWFYFPPTTCTSTTVTTPLVIYALSEAVQCGQTVQQSIFNMLAFILNNIQISCTNTSTSITCTFSDPTQLVQEWRLLVRDNTFGKGNVICDNTRTTSGSLSCNFGNTSVLVSLMFKYDGKYYTYRTLMLNNAIRSNFLQNDLAILFIGTLLVFIVAVMSHSLPNALFAIVFFLGLLMLFSIITIPTIFFVVAALIAVIFFVVSNKKLL